MMSAVTDSMAERAGRTLEQWVAQVAGWAVDPSTRTRCGWLGAAPRSTTGCATCCAPPEQNG
jgi:hypothetical protein